MPLSAEDEATIRAIYRRMHSAMVAADTSALSELLVSGFHLVHMTGYDQPRAEWLAHIDSGRMRYFSSVEEALVITCDGDHARLIGRNRVSADIWGARGTWPLQLDIQLSRQGGAWQMIDARASVY